MITQEIKSNINKIDYELKNLFENVYIQEKTHGNQYYFDITVNKLISIVESAGHKRCEVKLRINKSNLLTQNIKWSYLVNPLNENSDWIDRISNIENIANDINDIVLNKKMDSNYLESLEIFVDSINENTTEISEYSIITNITGILEKYGIKTLEVTSDEKPIMEGNSFMDTKPNTTFLIPHSSDIKISNQFKIESEINSLPNVNWTLFKEGFIEVNVSYEN